MDFFKRHTAWLLSFGLALFLVTTYQAVFAAPADFPAGSVITVSPGSFAPQVAQAFADAHVIAHPSVMRLVLRLTGKSDNVQAGAYRFESPQNVFSITRRLTTGAYGFSPVSITFIEGITVREMAAQVATTFPQISEEDFLREAQPYEGYLFPDTYLFFPFVDVATVVATMRENFDRKTSALSSDIHASGHSLSEIVILASLLEKEARTTTSRRMVSGIIENRLKLGMPLQVDAVFGYIFKRATYSPSLEDLKVDSPYNTYTHTGLPPGPIGNPGLESIQAALTPTKTSYIYYLTGKDGLMHYATTFVGHQANKSAYLN